jgi:CheY-like chemotaxis protein
MDTILIVDDSSFIVEGLIAFLKKKYRPLAVYGGAECLEILKRETPSVIILDIMMEPMDGWETLTRIKANPKTRHIPVLMFSAKKVSYQEAEEHRFNIDDFLTKPVSPKKIIEAIEKVLDRRDINREVVGRWKAAGISQEKIDEYLSLATNLEVDLSLCQNLKIQYDLTPSQDKNQDEFEAVIKAIEERILQERDLIEKLAREMNSLLDHGAILPGPAGAEALPITGESADRQQESTTFPGAKDDSPHPLPDPDTPLPVIPSDVPDSEAYPEELPGSPASVHEDIPLYGDQDVLATPSLSVSGDPGSESPLCDSGKAEHGSETLPEPIAPAIAPAQSPVPAADVLPVPSERKVIPADPDISPVRSRTPLMTGAGTDIPMPWDLSRDKKNRETVAGRDERKTGTLSAASPPSTGFFARIISLLQSILQKRK